MSNILSVEAKNWILDATILDKKEKKVFLKKFQKNIER